MVWGEVGVVVLDDDCELMREKVEKCQKSKMGKGKVAKIHKIPFSENLFPEHRK